MVLTVEIWSTGSETIYSVGGRWMNVYGALVEWYWQVKTEVLGVKQYIAWVVGEWMGMEHWWNGTDRGKLKCWETLYSVGGRWMNGYGALVQWYWQGKSEVLWGKNFSVYHRLPSVKHLSTCDRTRPPRWWTENFYTWIWSRQVFFFYFFFLTASTANLYVRCLTNPAALFWSANSPTQNIFFINSTTA